MSPERRDMHRNAKLLIIILSLFFIGCAPKMTVLLDGKPIPQYSYTLTNPETGIRLQVIAAKLAYADEDGERIIRPDYVGVGKCVEIDPDKAASFDIMVQVKNLDKAHYIIMQKQLIRPVLGSGQVSAAETIVYAGHLRYNSFRLTYVLKDNTYNKIDITVGNQKGMPLMTIGSFTFKVMRIPQSEEGR
jgi:hypothetical protein